MRLTLRTLLAYLDDRLSPGNAREIGRKISSSPFAQELADRIRTVVRQRRLTAPDRRVKLIDPNQIAEYLDDQLTPELVARIEKEILPSDFSLAEVAATHQILGVLGEPVEIHRRLQERLRALAPSAAVAGAGETSATLIPASADADPEAWKPLPPQGQVGRRSPILLLTVLFAGLCALIATDDVFFGNKAEQTESLASVDSPPQNAADDAPDEAAKQNPADDGNPVAVIDGPGNQAQEVSDETENDVDAAPDIATTSDDESEITDPPDAVAVVDLPKPPAAGDNSAIPDAQSDEVAQPVETADPTASKNPFEALRVERYSVSDPHGMLLARQTNGTEWQPARSLVTVAPDWQGILTSHILAVPTPFHPAVTPEDSGWSTTLLSPCLTTFHDGAIEIFEGRCVINGVETESRPITQLGLIVGNTPMLVEFTDPTTRFGVDVFPIAAAQTLRTISGATDEDTESGDGPDTDSGDAGDDEDGTAEVAPTDTEILPLSNATIAALYVAEGDVRVSIDGAEPVSVDKGRSFHWRAHAGTARDLRVSDPALPATIPQWVYTSAQPAMEEIEAIKQQIGDAVGNSDSLSETAQQLTEDRNSQLAAWGASIPSVTRQIDDLLVLLLSTSKDTVREQSILGLRQAAAQTTQGEQQVVKAVETRLPMREIDDALRLLYGLAPAQLEEEELSMWLLSMLSSERAAFRQLAIMNLATATGQTLGFHPDSDANRRRDAIRRWEKLFKRNGNRIIAPE